MYVFQWHLDVPFGKQKDALEVMRGWLEAELKDPDMPRPRRMRLLTGAIGISPTHIIAETEWDSLAAFESTMDVLATGRFKQYSEAIAKFIVPGSQHWTVLSVQEER